MDMVNQFTISVVQSTSLIVSGLREMYSSDTFFLAAEDDFETLKKKKKFLFTPMLFFYTG